MSTDNVTKICPRCKQKDFTNFSKCRNCGTRYDAHIEEPRGGGLDQRVILVVLGLAGAFASFQWGASAVKEAKLKRLAPLAAEIKAAGRPRVLEFYADWCGPCRNYGPVVESCKAKYAGQIDVVRINVDSRNPLARACDVHPIPKTCTFDRQGNEVDEVVGDIGQETLDRLMQRLITPK
jgi:thioredoxin 1